MNNRKTGKTLLAVAGAMSAGVAVWRVISYMEMQKKRKGETEANICQAQDRVGKEKLKEQFLRLFGLYEDSEFESFADFGEEGDVDLRECAADYYAERLYPYVKDNLKMVSSMEGDDGTGKEPFQMTDELFCEPACRICSQPLEDFFDNFHLVRETEIWLLESGQFAVVTCIFFEKDGWQLTWRFQENVIREPADIPISFEDLETELLQLMKEGEAE